MEISSIKRHIETPIMKYLLKETKILSIRAKKKKERKRNGTTRYDRIMNLVYLVSDDIFITAIADVVRAQPKDFMVVRQERVSIQIQVMFRCFMVNGSQFLP
ncbi:hypothetical protein PanWU01x14_225420 [Parasponia andersonii]|uniref:Uncharacterized protein n=1 Tax=Parasponia andersonii TaxID=3476 RepID=A0A2P5BMW6_PARAD|nr:hypothetical protein PanWU01x14_225420 [Parasponia andersonii]